jgi:hypothetical protein
MITQTGFLTPLKRQKSRRIGPKLGLLIDEQTQKGLMCAREKARKNEQKERNKNVVHPEAAH